jgi:hypothetical protein
LTSIALAISIAACGSGGGSGSSAFEETSRMEESRSSDFWLNSGGRFFSEGGFGHPIEGELPPDDAWRRTYSRTNPTDTDDGSRPQNVFRLVTRKTFDDVHQELGFRILQINPSASPERNESNGVLLLQHYLDGDNLYYAGVRVDGAAVVKKKLQGTYYTLGFVPLYPGSYDRDTNPNLIPTNRRITIATETHSNADQTVDITLSVDGAVALQVHDGGVGGPAITGPGFAGIRTDFMDVEFESYSVSEQ